MLTVKEPALVFKDFSSGFVKTSTLDVRTLLYCFVMATGPVMPILLFFSRQGTVYNGHWTLDFAFLFFPSSTYQ